MKTTSFTPGRKVLFVTLITIIFFQGFMPAFGQQNIIADKENIHPETDRAFSSPAFIASFTAQKWNGYNEIAWTATREQDTRKYIVEYSSNGIVFQTEGEVLVNNSNNSLYSLNHFTADDHAVLYRIKMEQLNGKFAYSEALFLDGATIALVTIYPTIVTGNVINMNALFAVEHITIVSANGRQVFAKDVIGQKDNITVVILSLGKGIYLMTFYGSGWKTTNKFIVG